MVRACGLVLIGLLGGVAGAQVHGRPVPRLPVGGSAAIPAGWAAVLVGLGARAGVIFAGQVLRVDRNDAAGYVDVVFRVDTAVRGCGKSSQYVVREWAGLWAGQAARYRVGQRRLMLLSARGASGMSAPVGGMAGVMPLVGAREPPLARGTGVAPAETASEAEVGEAVDLRWVQAEAVRTVSAGFVPEVDPVRRWRGPVLPMPPVKPVVSPGPSLSAVLALLGQGDGR